MIFFGLTDTDLSQLRVIDRTREGGHYVDPFTVCANFFGNLEKLNTYYGIFDSLQIIDTSEAEHKVLSVFINGEVESSINSSLLPSWFKNNLPDVLMKIKEKQGAIS